MWGRGGTQPLPGTHGAVETRASSNPSWSTSALFFFRGTII
jgi:hypothetical protein